MKAFGTVKSFNKALKEVRLSRDDKAQDAKELTPEEVAREKEELKSKARELIECEDILSQLIPVLRKLGLTGEERNAKLAYLILTTRILPKLVSAVIRGPSSGGKSYVAEMLLKLFPPSAYFSLTSLSERALAFFEDSMAHRFLILAEAAGLNSDIGKYLIRSLLSEGRIKYLVAEKAPDNRIRSVLKELEGPTGLFATTTRVSIERELETRLLSLEINDTDEQTGRILQAQAEAENGESPPDLEPWHAFQRLLELERPQVEIPYARQLAESCRIQGIRLRRDFSQVLQLIKAHTAFYMYQRQRTASGKIVATLEDYAAVHGLVSDLISQGVDTAVSCTIKETVQVVRDLLIDMEEVRIIHVGNALGISKQAAQQRVYRATHKGYLINKEDRRGKPARLALGDPLPSESEILPRPEEMTGNRGRGSNSIDRLTATHSPYNSEDLAVNHPKVDRIDQLTAPRGEAVNRSTTVNSPRLTANCPNSDVESGQVNRSTTKSDHESLPLLEGVI